VKLVLSRNGTAQFTFMAYTALCCVLKWHLCGEIPLFRLVGIVGHVVGLV